MASSGLPRPPENPGKPGDCNAARNNEPKPATREMKSGRRPVSLPAGELSVANRKRASYHQDVEEALSSLLWQPYEYRTQSESSSSDTLSLSLSTGSSSYESSLSYEYATVCKNKLLHSFTDEFLNVATVVPDLRHGQMVGDLEGRGGRSRGLTATSQADSGRSRARDLASDSAGDGVAVSAADASDMIPSNTTSVVSANVVGLPPIPSNLPPVSVHHVRAASETASTNISNVNVNFYRAVPVNVVSNVPTIQCVNSVEEPGNNVSNVHIVQAMPPSTIPPQQVHVQHTRTFTSTEAQTDDTIVSATVVSSSSREQRRRERRERRHQRRINSSNHQHLQQQQQHQQAQQHQQNDRLPDLLNSHLPPPYSTLPLAMVGPPPPPPGPMVSYHPGVVPVVQAAPPPVPVPVPVPAPPTGFRFPFPNSTGFRRCRSRLGPRYSSDEPQPKSCCGFLASRPGSLRWFIALIALVAVCCVLVGTVLGAMRPAGRDHLTVSLLMIGVGIVLVTVSGVAWRLTSHDAPSCRAMLGLDAGDADACPRRFVPRLPPSYGRPHHPYAAMIYPEFQYRPPPPSYQASMQEYRLRLLLLDRAGNAGQQQVGGQQAVSPPPTYRSHAGSLLRAPLSNRRDTSQSEYSCPPSYRSRSSSNRPTNQDTISHSREQSLTLSESNHDDSVVNVVSILANQEEEITLENMALDSLKVAPEHEIPPLRMLLKSSSGSELETSKDGNLVTIVQKADQNPVIVTVSGSQMSTTNPEVGSSNQIPSEMEILAHL